MNNISAQIKKFRNRKGMTQEQLGASVGVSMQAVSKWERGGTPDIELLPTLADVLGVSIDELFGRKQKSLEETISEVIYAVDTKNSYEYAFELCWAILSGLAHIDGNIRASATSQSSWRTAASPAHGWLPASAPSSLCRSPRAASAIN